MGSAPKRLAQPFMAQRALYLGCLVHQVVAVNIFHFQGSMELQLQELLRKRNFFCQSCFALACFPQCDLTTC